MNAPAAADYSCQTLLLLSDDDFGVFLYTLNAVDVMTTPVLQAWQDGNAGAGLEPADGANTEFNGQPKNTQIPNSGYVQSGVP